MSSTEAKKKQCRQDPKGEKTSKVALGHTEEDAVNEARRCLDCKKTYMYGGILSMQILFH